MKLISIPLIIISFLLGLFLVNFVNPEKKIIYVYPNSSNLDRIQYVDKAKNCFYANKFKTKCNLGINNIKEVPIQT